VDEAFGQVTRHLDRMPPQGIVSGLPTIHAGSNPFRERHQEELLDKIHARGTVRAKAHCASDEANASAHVCA
jgi:hypothetical protein